MSFDPTGRQIFLRAERDGHVISAQITQVGASLRHLVVDGVEVVPPYAAGMPAPSASGIVLMPWPNRIADGIWMHEGEQRRLAITEPDLNNAIHGLLRYTSYDTTEADGAVTLRADVVPQTGYPFYLQTSVTYALTADGIAVTHTVRNVGDKAAPVAIGTHPFLTLGDTPAEELTLTSSGSTYITVDDRLIPTGRAEVNSSNDLRGGATLSELVLDTAYADLERNEDGRIVHTLSDTSGRAVSLWQGEDFDFVQFYTSRPYPTRTVAVACEPMTAPANAFNSGEGLRWLEPDQAWSVQWGITYSAGE